MTQFKQTKALVRSLSLVALLAAGFMFCQFKYGSVNPVTGKTEVTFVSEEEEVEIGEEVFFHMIQESGGQYVDNAELHDYVNEVGHKLAKLSDRPNLPYEFVIVNDDSLNAWALPGGKIAINKGLLKMMDNEAELAAVLAHEITHAAARHSAERWERSTVRPATDALLLIFNPTHSFFLASEMSGDALESKYSRDAEFEADKYGIEYMARAGYDVSAAKTVHEKLAAAADKEGKTFADTLLDSHPNDTDRICNAEHLSSFYPPHGILGEGIYKQKTSVLN